MTKLLTIPELAETLRRSPTTIYHQWKKWHSEGRMKVTLIGGRPHFSEKEVDKLIKSFEV